MLQFACPERFAHGGVSHLICSTSISYWAQYPDELCPSLRILHPTIYVQSQRSVPVQEVCSSCSKEDCKGMQVGVVDLFVARPNTDLQLMFLFSIIINLTKCFSCSTFKFLYVTFRKYLLTMTPLAVKSTTVSIPLLALSQHRPKQ